MDGGGARARNQNYAKTTKSHTRTNLKSPSTLALQGAPHSYPLPPQSPIAPPPSHLPTHAPATLTRPASLLPHLRPDPTYAAPHPNTKHPLTSPPSCVSTCLCPTPTPPHILTHLTTLLPPPPPPQLRLHPACGARLPGQLLFLGRRRHPRYRRGGPARYRRGPRVRLGPSPPPDRSPLHLPAPAVQTALLATTKTPPGRRGYGGSGTSCLPDGPPAAGGKRPHGAGVGPRGYQRAVCAVD